jgi:hypothetical protein
LLCFRIRRIHMFLGCPDPSLFCTDPDPSASKKGKKTLISTISWRLPFDFLFLKTDVNVPSKRIRKKNLEKTYFLLASCPPLTKERIRKSVEGIRGSWSVTKCHVSTTLVVIHTEHLFFDLPTSSNFFCVVLAKFCVPVSLQATPLRFFLSVYLLHPISCDTPLLNRNTKVVQVSTGTCYFRERTN